MFKKNLLLISAIFIVLVILSVVRLLSPEDGWICVDGEWAKHGNPISEKPEGNCPLTSSYTNKESSVDLSSTEYELYFLNNVLDPEISCIKVFPVIRKTEQAQLRLENVLNYLFSGVSEEDKNGGYYTSIPENVKVNYIKRDGVSVQVDLSRELDEGIGGSCRVGAIRAQIIRTVYAFDKTIRSVIISIDGETETILQP